MTPEPIRTLHHFACTGGTLIAKCLAGMPNVILLNEVDPLSRLHLTAKKQPFLPTDPIAALRYAHRSVEEGTLEAMFAASLGALKRDLDADGLSLVLRDHTHSHFCTGEAVRPSRTLRALAGGVAPVLSVVTVRHPRDSFVSLSARNWLHFAPATVEEYARRYLAFLDAHEGVERHRYEDFVAAPQDGARRLCADLGLAFSPDFEETLPLFALSGDSGRIGARIAPRPRRDAPAEIARAMADSASFARLCERLGYDPDG